MSEATNVATRDEGSSVIDPQLEAMFASIRAGLVAFAADGCEMSDTGRQGFSATLAVVEQAYSAMTAAAEAERLRAELAEVRAHLQGVIASSAVTVALMDECLGGAEA